MRKIRVGFSTPKKKAPLFAWGIMAYEGTPFSHTYIRWQTRYGSWLCYHAASVMVHFLGEYAFASRINIIEEFEFEISDAQFELLMEFCIKYAGVDYALSEVLMIPLWDAGFVRNDVSDPWSQYCAELVCRALGVIQSKELTASPDRIKLKAIYNSVKEKVAQGAAL